jgi:hypothetical protein
MKIGKRCSPESKLKNNSGSTLPNPYSVIFQSLAESRLFLIRDRLRNHNIFTIKSNFKTKVSGTLTDKRSVDLYLDFGKGKHFGKLFQEKDSSRSSLLSKKKSETLTGDGFF